MTQGKLKMFRRDRLYALDKERVTNLVDCLKNVRTTDEASLFGTSASSPVKTKTVQSEVTAPSSPLPGQRGGIRATTTQGASFGGSKPVTTVNDKAP